jgi:hypothetical protein
MRLNVWMKLVRAEAYKSGELKEITVLKRERELSSLHFHFRSLAQRRSEVTIIVKRKKVIFLPQSAK